MTINRIQEKACYTLVHRYPKELGGQSQSLEPGISAHFGEKTLWKIPNQIALFIEWFPRYPGTVTVTQWYDRVSRRVIQWLRSKRGCKGNNRAEDVLS